MEKGKMKNLMDSYGLEAKTRYPYKEIIRQVERDISIGNLPKACFEMLGTLRVVNKDKFIDGMNIAEKYRNFPEAYFRCFIIRSDMNKIHTRFGPVTLQQSVIFEEMERENRAGVDFFLARLSEEEQSEYKLKNLFNSSEAQVILFRSVVYAYLDMWEEVEQNKGLEKFTEEVLSLMMKTARKNLAKKQE